MEKVKKWFKNLKIGQKLLVCNVGIILIMAILIGGCGYSISRNMLLSSSQDQSLKLMEQLSSNYSYAVDTIEELITSQTYNREFSSILRTDTQAMSKSQMYDRRKQVQACGFNLINFNKYITNVLIADNFDNIYYISGRDEKIEARHQAECLDIQTAKEMWGVSCWKPYDESQVFVTKQVFDHNNMKPLAVVAVGVDAAYFTERYESIVDKGTGIVILNKDQEILLSSDEESRELAQVILAKYPQESYQGKEIFFRNEKYIYTTQKAPKSRIQVMNLISESEITAVIYRNLMVPLMVLLGAAVLLSAGLALLISGQISSNIRLLLENIRKRSRGDFSGEIIPDGYDEIGMLAEEFNHMSTKVENLLQTVADEKIQKKNSQLRAMQFEYDSLQAKINPHFLYNTLESINSLAKINGQETISKCIYLLGNYLREAISNHRKFVKLEEEMINARRYLEIQKLSHGDKIQVEFDNDEAVGEVMVPKLILQPLVENAIVHGLEMKIGQGHIRITSRCEGTDLVIRVEDDGVGISSEKIEAVMSGQEYFNPGHTKVGLQAVHKRIQILYGEAYGIKIESEKNEGTCIYMHLPIIFEDEVEKDEL